MDNFVELNWIYYHFGVYSKNVYIVPITILKIIWEKLYASLHSLETENYQDL